MQRWDQVVESWISDHIALRARVRGWYEPGVDHGHPDFWEPSSGEESVEDTELVWCGSVPSVRRPVDLEWLGCVIGEPLVEQLLDQLRWCAQSLAED